MIFGSLLKHRSILPHLDLLSGRSGGLHSLVAGTGVAALFALRATLFKAMNGCRITAAAALGMVLFRGRPHFLFSVGSTSDMITTGSGSGVACLGVRTGAGGDGSLCSSILGSGATSGNSGGGTPRGS